MSTKKGLSQQAYEPVPDGETYEPYVSATESPAEFTAKALVAGVLFGIVFGAANAYLGLQAGLTISTSIPVAVMTVAAFRAMRRGTILEANLSQTVGSASSSVASGVIFTLPALFLWGSPPGLLQMTLLAMCGGLLGVLFMIPLRRFLIQREHGHLPYPEGTACAEVLVAAEVGGGRARNVFLGLGAGTLFKAIFGWAKLFPGTVKFPVPLIPKAQLGLKMSAALFGVGYILGPRIGAIMVGGGLLSSLIIIPLIGVWGADRTQPLYPELDKLITEMGPGEIWEKYVRYIGAGAVATAGLITLVRSIPMMVESFRVGAKQLADRLGNKSETVLRTGRDLPLSVVAVGAGVILLVMAFVPQVFGALGGVLVHFIAAVCVIVFAFFFVTVASRIVGLVGVTSNPTSGMTIASLIGTSAVFLLMGWTDAMGKVSALCVGCVVAIAASISGDTSQDLKTGFLLGATPRRQQIGELIGVLTAATFVCMTVMMLGKQPGGGFGSESLPAPQATLMKLVIDGILERKLPWVLVAIGAGIAVVVELLRLPSLPFAVGVYLPVTTMVPVFLGGLLRLALQRRAASETEKASRRENGVLFGSGLVGGEGLLGVCVAGAAFYYKEAPEGFGSAWASDFAKSLGAPAEVVAAMPSVLALVVLAVLVWAFARCCKARFG
ncbi:MAG: oligopeptide transporter, OPT family [Phycisphaerales bacterium]|nr:oligopeptide transporter, OPT family [Phycisphaerales bacterium]